MQRPDDGIEPDRSLNFCEYFRQASTTVTLTDQDWQPVIRRIEENAVDRPNESKALEIFEQLEES